MTEQIQNGQIYSILLFSHLEQLSTAHLGVSKEGKASDQTLPCSCLLWAFHLAREYISNTPYKFLSTEFRGVKHFEIPLDDVIQGYKFTIYHTYPHITVCMNIS